MQMESNSKNIQRASFLLVHENSVFTEMKCGAGQIFKKITLYLLFAFEDDSWTQTSSFKWNQIGKKGSTELWESKIVSEEMVGAFNFLWKNLLIWAAPLWVLALKAMKVHSDKLLKIFGAWSPLRDCLELPKQIKFKKMSKVENMSIF